MRQESPTHFNSSTQEEDKENKNVESQAQLEKKEI